MSAAGGWVPEKDSESAVRGNGDQLPKRTVDNGERQQLCYHRPKPVILQMRKLRPGGESLPQPHNYLQADLSPILLTWPGRKNFSGHLGKTALEYKLRNPRKIPKSYSTVSSAHLGHCPVPKTDLKKPLEISTQTHLELPFLSYTNDSWSKAAC